MKQKVARFLSQAGVVRNGYAGCPPDGYYSYRCIDGKKYRRYCYTPPSCGADICGPYSYVGLC